MPYEIDFHPVGKGDNSGDAITLRYHDGAAWRAIVIDGGYQDTGEAICDHIRSAYGLDTIQHVISTHPDNDHISGLRVVLARMRVENLWLHVPEVHAAQIQHLFRDARWTLEGLTDSLGASYPLVGELIQLARRQATNIYEPFQGAAIGPFTVLSPTTAMYEGLLPQFRDTPKPNQELLASLGHWLTGIGRRIARTVRKVVPENWITETLREGGLTAAENESSVILYGRLDPTSRNIVLTADAGLRALETAFFYGITNGCFFGDALALFQVPHHGSRNNLSPIALNRFVGTPLNEGQRRNIACVISAGFEDATHPRQVVVNALNRRGLEPMTTRFGVLNFRVGVPARQGLSPPRTLPFENRVEDYD